MNIARFNGNIFLSVNNLIRRYFEFIICSALDSRNRILGCHRILDGCKLLNLVLFTVMIALISVNDISVGILIPVPVDGYRTVGPVLDISLESSEITDIIIKLFRILPCHKNIFGQMAGLKSICTVLVKRSLNR